MQQNDLHRAVARATGETVSRIKRVGFLLAEPHHDFPDPHDEQWGPQVIDWDVPPEQPAPHEERSRAAS